MLTPVLGGGGAGHADTRLRSGTEHQGCPHSPPPPGVKRVGKGTWVEARLALVDFLGKAVRRAVILAEHCRRYTVTGNDMVYALKQMGRCAGSDTKLLGASWAG